MESFIKIETFKSLKEVMESFFNGKNCKTPKKVMASFFSIKNFRSRKTLMEFFLSFKIFKSRKKLIESFFSGQTSLSFRMMHKFPGTTFDYIGTTLEQNFKIVRNNRLELSVMQLFRRFLEIPAEKRL